MRTTPPPFAPNRLRPLALTGAALGLALLLAHRPAPAADVLPQPKPKPEAKVESSPEAKPKADGKADLGERIKEGIEKSNANPKAKSVPVVQVKLPPGALANPVDARGSRTMAASAAEPARAEPSSRDYLRARAAALAGQAQSGDAPEAKAEEHAHASMHWEYDGSNGPAAWGKMNPEFSTCALGRRQSPIHITDADTLQGPAEALMLRYTPSSGSVVNNGHTIQVDLDGEQNTLTVRGSTYKLVQFHFHHPAEEKVNYKGFSLVAHLVHKNDQNQLAVLAVLMDPGAPNPLIHKVWTYMPLDVQDRVKMPLGLIDVNELLPQDRRYYQFMGSLTTPPCTEGVLWLVLKTPMTLGIDQMRLFAKLFPNNARPTQPLNGRVIREAQ